MTKYNCSSFDKIRPQNFVQGENLRFFFHFVCVCFVLCFSSKIESLFGWDFGNIYLIRVTKRRSRKEEKEGEVINLFLVEDGELEREGKRNFKLQDKTYEVACE